ncbi:MAG: glycosyltransferase family 4 protein [Acidobacteria bacterium]|nr:glycosyltransferase family 4 protein [Acidobacteriota bacterium]
MVFTAVILLISGGLLSYLGTLAFLRWSRKRDLLDIPNERSSHTVPVPRGAGLVIAIVCLVGYSLAGIFFNVPFSLVFLAAGAVIALIGWADDLYSVPRILRVSIQGICGLALIYAVGYFDSVTFGPKTLAVTLWVFGIAVTFCWFIWVVNAFNFMDGIDGIAAGTGTAAAVFWLIFGYYYHALGIVVFAGLCGGACLGFLFFNRHPAKVFMGDVGSSFLGFAFAALPILALSQSDAERENVLLFAAASIWPFIFDTLFTFVRRLPKMGISVWRPHRSHIYQVMVDHGMTHSRVAVIYIGCSLATGAAALGSMMFRGYLSYAPAAAMVFVSVILVLFYMRCKKPRST